MERIGEMEEMDWTEEELRLHGSGGAEQRGRFEIRITL